MLFGTLNGASRSRANDRELRRIRRADEERRHRLPPLRIRPPEHPRLRHRRVRQAGPPRPPSASRSRRRTRSCPPCAPRTISRPRSSNRPRSPVCSTPPPATDGPGHEDLAVVRQRHVEPGQRAARRLRVARLGDRDGRTRLREPVATARPASPPRAHGRAATDRRARRRAARPAATAEAAIESAARAGSAPATRP